MYGITTLFIYKSILLIMFLIIGINCAKVKPASSYFQICNKKGEELNKCIIKSMMEAKSTLIKGIPEIGLPSIEPLHVERLELAQGQGNLRYHHTFYNLHIHNISSYEVKDISFDLDKLSFSAVFFFKNMIFDGDYEIDAQVLIMPLKGSGKVYFNFTDITIQLSSVLERFDKNGVEYVRIKSNKFKIEPKDVKISFTNLFNGNEELGDAANKFLNENWREAYEVFRDVPEEAFAKLTQSLSNKVFEAFSIKELYPSLA